MQNPNQPFNPSSLPLHALEDCQELLLHLLRHQDSSPEARRNLARVLLRVLFVRRELFPGSFLEPDLATYQALERVLLHLV